jgi:hypothetical protein
MTTMICLSSSAAAKRARSEEPEPKPKILSRRQLMRLSKRARTSSPFAERIAKRSALRGIAVTPSPLASPAASPPETPTGSEDPDSLSDGDSGPAPAPVLALAPVPAPATPFGSRPVVPTNIDNDDARATPTKITLQVITGGDMQLIDTIDDASAAEIRSVMPPTAGYSYVWLVLENALFRLDLCYHPMETGMAHELICTIIRPTGKRTAFPLSCCVVHDPATGDIGLATDTSHMWSPGVMPEPNSPLSIFASWLQKYVGFSLVCLVPE